MVRNRCDIGAYAMPKNYLDKRNISGRLVSESDKRIELCDCAVVPMKTDAAFYQMWVFYWNRRIEQPRFGIIKHEIFSRFEIQYSRTFGSLVTQPRKCVSRRKWQWRCRTCSRNSPNWSNWLAKEISSIDITISAVTAKQNRKHMVRYETSSDSTYTHDYATKRPEN